MTANGNSNGADVGGESGNKRQTKTEVDQDEWSKIATQYVDIADKKQEAWVDTTEFNLAIGAAILVNALMIGVETEMCAFFVRPIAASQENYRTPAAIGSLSISLCVCVCVRVRVRVRMLHCLV